LSDAFRGAECFSIFNHKCAFEMFIAFSAFETILVPVLVQCYSDGSSDFEVASVTFCMCIAMFMELFLFVVGNHCSREFLTAFVTAHIVVLDWIASCLS